MIRVLIIEAIQVLSFLGMVVIVRWLLELSTPKADLQAIERTYDRVRLDVRETLGALGLSLYSFSWGGQTDPRVAWLRQQMRESTPEPAEVVEDVKPSDEQST